MKSVKELGRVIERRGRLRTADGLAGKACVSVTRGPVELENKA